MNEQTGRSVSDGSTWLRLVFMVLFGIVLYVLMYVLAVVTAVQFLCKLFTGRVFVRLMAFGQSLGLFLYQIVAFLTYRTERRPFPFAPWPAGRADAQRRRSDRPGAPPRPASAKPTQERRGGMRVVRTAARQAQDNTKPKT